MSVLWNHWKILLFPWYLGSVSNVDMQIKRGFLNLLKIINNKGTMKNINVITNVAYIRVVASNHFSIWYLMTQTVCGLVGVHWHVQDIWWVNWQERLLEIRTRKIQKGNHKLIIWWTIKMFIIINSKSNLCSTCDEKILILKPVFNIFLSWWVIIRTFSSSAFGSSLILKSSATSFYKKNQKKQILLD